MAENFEMWDEMDVVSFFDGHRVSEKDVYPSEWFFLEKYLQNNMSILDIGCAQGGFASIIERKISGFSYTGLDVSKKMIEKAMLRHPKYFFHHVNGGDYSILKGMFDLTLVLGILHLHEMWRETIEVAWRHTKSVLILDLRETFGDTIEDKEKSYFYMGKERRGGILPYNLINAGDALRVISTICADAKKISHYGYSQKPSDYAVCPVTDVFVNVYCIEK